MLYLQLEPALEGPTVLFKCRVTPYYNRIGYTNPSGVALLRVGRYTSKWVISECRRSGI
jgi:hypothetical protein